MSRIEFTPESPARILIVDDHPLVRYGLMKLLEDENDLLVVDQFTDAATTLERMASIHPDLLIVDISLQGTNGLDLIMQARAALPARGGHP